MRKKLFLIWVFFVFLPLGSAFSFELPLISKSKIRIIAEPGKTTYGDMVVENQSDKETSVRLYLNDWKYLPAGDGTKEFFPAQTTPLSCASWITFSPSELTLAPFSKQKVNYSVKIPPDASGGHYAALFFESLMGSIEPKSGEIRAGMNIVIRVATLFYVEPRGKTARSGIVKDLTYENSKDPYGFSLKLDFLNTGTTDITAAGTFDIMDNNGMVVSRGEFKNAYTFSGSHASLVAVSKSKVPQGTYDLVVTIDLGKALEEADLGRGPVITKEAEIEFDSDGFIKRIGELK